MGPALVVTVPERPQDTVLRARVAQLLTLVCLGLVVLSILGVAGFWSLASAVVLFLVVCYLDGSLVRWWRRDR